MSCGVDVSVVIPSFNTRELTLRSIASVYAHTTGLSFEVVVVDNGSTDGSVEALRHEWPHVVVHANASNLGFARAANQGLALARAPWVLFLNSDAYLRDDALSAMVHFAVRDSTLAAVGCRIVNPDGSHQPSAGRMPTLALDASDQFLRPLKWLPARWRRNCVLATDYREPVPVDWVAGSCVMMRRAALVEVGGFDETFAFGDEDIDLCARLRRAGWQVVYFPRVSVVHLGGRSRPRYADAARELWAGRYKLYLKHRGVRVARRYRRLMLASIGLRWLAAAAVGRFASGAGGSRVEEYARLWSSIRQW
jgi:GT2 family glycosyltransferase